MLKKNFFYWLFFFIFLNSTYLLANSQGYRDELPELKRLSDLTIGINRIKKGLKYESKGKIKKANRMYQESIKFLLEANKNQDIDPNIFFYLGFAHNKLNKLNDAEIYFTLGLTIDPTHSYLNLHIGELYLNTNRVALARDKLKILNTCNCDQYFELKESIAKYNN